MLPQSKRPKDLTCQRLPAHLLPSALTLPGSPRKRWLAGHSFLQVPQLSTLGWFPEQPKEAIKDFLNESQHVPPPKSAALKPEGAFKGAKGPGPDTVKHVCEATVQEAMLLQHKAMKMWE